jgi:alkylation response protein AidB-like acyl-CoA dehydrogenase
MDVELTREQKMIVKNVKAFMRKEIAPLADELDRECHLPEGIWQTFGDLGLLGLGIPEEYGGSGMDTFTFTLVVEQIARVCPGIALSYVAHSNLCAHNIEHNATEAFFNRSSNTAQIEYSPRNRIRSPWILGNRSSRTLERPCGMNGIY